MAWYRSLSSSRSSRRSVARTAPSAAFERAEGAVEREDKLVQDDVLRVVQDEER